MTDVAGPTNQLRNDDAGPANVARRRGAARARSRRRRARAPDRARDRLPIRIVDAPRIRLLGRRRTSVVLRPRCRTFSTDGCGIEYTPGKIIVVPPANGTTPSSMLCTCMTGIGRTPSPSVAVREPPPARSPRCDPTLPAASRYAIIAPFESPVA
jgi:hypothetical protein